MFSSIQLKCSFGLICFQRSSKANVFKYPDRTLFWNALLIWRNLQGKRHHVVHPELRKTLQDRQQLRIQMPTNLEIPFQAPHQLQQLTSLQKASCVDYSDACRDPCCLNLLCADPLGVNPHMTGTPKTTINLKCRELLVCASLQRGLNNKALLRKLSWCLTGTRFLRSAA